MEKELEIITIYGHDVQFVETINGELNWYIKNLPRGISYDEEDCINTIITQYIIDEGLFELFIDKKEINDIMIETLNDMDDEDGVE